MESNQCPRGYRPGSPAKIRRRVQRGSYRLMQVARTTLTTFMSFHEHFFVGTFPSGGVATAAGHSDARGAEPWLARDSSYCVQQEVAEAFVYGKLV